VLRDPAADDVTVEHGEQQQLLWRRRLTHLLDRRRPFVRQNRNANTPPGVEIGVGDRLAQRNH
jgi:hypothetical protein